MTTKELIHAEIDTFSENNLNELHILIKQFAQSKQKPAHQSLMAKLQQIHIDAPADFSTNFNQYINGKKNAKNNLIQPVLERRLGTATGLFIMSEDFDELLEDFKGYQ